MKVIHRRYNGVQVRVASKDQRAWFPLRDILAAVGYSNSQITKYHIDLPKEYITFLKIQEDTKRLVAVSLLGALTLIHKFQNLTLDEKADFQCFLMFRLFPLVQSMDNHAFFSSAVAAGLAERFEEGVV